MKKRHILFLLTALVLIAVSILPPFATRISYEQQHKGFVTALELNDTRALFDNADFGAVLKDYKASGVSAAVLREAEDGSFDANLLSLAKEAGLDAALMVYVGEEKSITYANAIKSLVENYGVKYLLLKEIKGVNTHEAPIAQIIEDYDLTLVLCENANQLSNESPIGFEACVKAANGRILRCYETQKTPAKYLTSGEYDPELVYYQMMNSARDRNTEFLLINQITDAADTAAKNAKVTQNAITKFCAWMDKTGYTPGVAGTLAGYDPSLRAINAAAACIGVLMLVPMLCALLKKSMRGIEGAIFALALAAYGVTWVLPMQLVLLYPTLFAPLGACFSFTVCYVCAEKLKARFNGFTYTCIVLAISLVTLLACCVVLSAMLSGAAYYLNIYIFRGVILTLTVPLLYAVLLLYCRAENKTFKLAEIKENTKRILKQIKPWHIIAIVLVVIVLAVYLLRSGNMKISGLENKIRNVIGEISLARPRTKEFLIGWPALALFAYYMKQDHSKLFTWIFAAGSSILFASIMNTFCHVFTDATTSLLRTVNGLVFAMPFILLALAANRVLVKVIFKK